MNTLHTRWCAGLLLLGVLGGCSSDDTPFQPDADLIVIRAYLFEGLLVEDVEVTRAVPLDSEDQSPPTVDEAVITLENGGQSYPLISTLGAPGFYHDPTGSIQVRPGETWILRLEIEGAEVVAETTVPSPPTGLELSDHVLAVTEIVPGGFRPGGFGGANVFGNLTVRWSNPDSELHFVVVDNLEEDPEQFPTNEFFAARPVRFVSAPTPGDSTFVSQLQLTHFGRHRVSLFRVNQEYADLYEGRVQDSRDLNEPPSNIVGGLGVFSAFAAESAVFTAAPSDEG